MLVGVQDGVVFTATLRGFGFRILRGYSEI